MKLHPKVIGWSDADFGRSSSKRISEFQCQPNDAPVILSDGTGISHDGKAWHRGPRVNPRYADDALPEGCLDVATLLKDVRKAAGKDVKKLLILDLGRLAIDPRIGLLVNEFPSCSMMKAGDVR